MEELKENLTQQVIEQTASCTKEKAVCRIKLQYTALKPYRNTILLYSINKNKKREEHPGRVPLLFLAVLHTSYGNGCPVDTDSEEYHFSLVTCG